MPVAVERMAVRIEFIEDVLGSWPADENLFTRFVNSKAPSSWLQAEEADDLPERTLQTGMTVFPQDEVGLHFFDYHVKSFLKEACNVLKDALGVKNLRNKINNYVFIRPRRLYLYRDGKAVKEADEVLERPVRGETLRGPRVSLVSSEVVKAPAFLEFVVEVVVNKEVNLPVIRDLLDYGSYKGLGQWRNGGWGSFRWWEIDVKEVLPQLAGRL